VNDTITIDINYHGYDCNNTHNRTGDVVIKKRYLENWGQAGATVLVTLNNFTITKLSTNKSLTLNGTKYFENVSGHYLWQLGLDSTVTSVVHKVWGTITATFDDNTTRVWNITRQRTFTGSLINLVMTTDGFGIADGYTSLSAWESTVTENSFTPLFSSRWFTNRLRLESLLRNYQTRDSLCFKIGNRYFRLRQQ